MNALFCFKCIFRWAFHAGLLQGGSGIGRSPAHNFPGQEFAALRRARLTYSCQAFQAQHKKAKKARGNVPRAESAAVPYHDNNSIRQSQGRGLDAASRWFYSFFKFSRPHTMLGTFISIISVSLLAMVSSVLLKRVSPELHL